jgi:hypothetical protein
MEKMSYMTLQDGYTYLIREKRGTSLKIMNIYMCSNQEKRKNILQNEEGSMGKIQK